MTAAIHARPCRVLALAIGLLALAGGGADARAQPRSASVAYDVYTGGLQVLDASCRTTVPGLYAAGEIVGASTFAGQSFAGGMSITPALGFGRLLGDSLLRW